MGTKIKTPIELDMLLFVNKYLRATGRHELKKRDIGYSFLKGHIEEIEYLEYMDELSNLYIYARQWNKDNNNILLDNEAETD